MRKTMLSALLFSGMLLAQGGPPPDGPRAPRREALKEALNINDEQAEQLVEFVREQRQSMFEGLKADQVFEKMRANRQAIRTAVESGNPDAAAVGALVIEGHALATKVKAAHDAFQEAAQNYVKNTLGRASELAELQAAAELQRAVREARSLGLIEGRPDRPGPGPFGFGDGPEGLAGQVGQRLRGLR